MIVYNQLKWNLLSIRESRCRKGDVAVLSVCLNLDIPCLISFDHVVIKV